MGLRWRPGVLPVIQLVPGATLDSLHHHTLDILQNGFTTHTGGPADVWLLTYRAAEPISITDSAVATCLLPQPRTGDGEGHAGQNTTSVPQTCITRMAGTGGCPPPTGGGRSHLPHMGRGTPRAITPSSKHASSSALFPTPPVLALDIAAGNNWSVHVVLAVAAMVDITCTEQAGGWRGQAPTRRFISP